MRKTILASVIGATAFTALMSGQAIAQDFYYRYPIANASNDDGSGGSGGGNTDTGGGSGGETDPGDTETCGEGMIEVDGNCVEDEETETSNLGIINAYTAEGELEFGLGLSNLDTSQPVNFVITSSSSDSTYDISGDVYYDENSDVVSLNSNAPSDNYTYITDPSYGEEFWRLSFDISYLERVKDATSFTVSVEGVNDIGAVYTDSTNLPSIYYSNKGFYQYIDTSATGSCDTGYSKKYQYDSGWTEVCFKNIITRSESTVNDIGPGACPYIDAYDSIAGGYENISDGYTYVYPEGDTYNYSYPSGSEYYDSCVLDTVYEEPISEIYAAEVTFSNLAVNDSKQLSFDYVANDIDFGNGIEVALSSSSGTDSFIKYDKYGSVINYDISSIYAPNENLDIEMSYIDLGGVVGQDTTTVLMPESVSEPNPEPQVITGFSGSIYNYSYILETSKTNIIDINQPITFTISALDASDNVISSSSDITGSFNYDVDGNIINLTSNNASVSSSIDYNTNLYSKLSIDGENLNTLSGASSIRVVLEATDNTSGQIVDVVDTEILKY